jgi:leucyl-tRNA synthetase
MLVPDSLQEATRQERSLSVCLPLHKYDDPRSSETSSEKKEWKIKRWEEQVLTKFEILKQIGVSEKEITDFVEPKYWLEFFLPKDQQYLKEFSVFVNCCGSFITTKVNPFYNSIIKWLFNTLKAAEKVKFRNRPIVTMG